MDGKNNQDNIMLYQIQRSVRDGEYLKSLVLIDNVFKVFSASVPEQNHASFTEEDVAENLNKAVEALGEKQPLRCMKRCFKLAKMGYQAKNLASPLFYQAVLLANLAVSNRLSRKANLIDELYLLGIYVPSEDIFICSLIKYSHVYSFFCRKNSDQIIAKLFKDGQEKELIVDRLKPSSFTSDSKMAQALASLANCCKFTVMDGKLVLNPLLLGGGNSISSKKNIGACYNVIHAIVQNDPDALVRYATANPKSIFEADEDGIFPIHHAVLNGNYSMVHMLVRQYKVPVNCATLNHGKGVAAFGSALSLALYVKKLTFFDCDLDKTVAPSSEEAGLMMLEFLLSEGADPNMRLPNGKDLLYQLVMSFFAGYSSAFESRLDLLLKFNLDIHTLYPDGSILHVIAKMPNAGDLSDLKRIQLISILHQKGASFAIRDSRSKYAHEIATSPLVEMFMSKLSFGYCNLIGLCLNSYSKSQYSRKEHVVNSLVGIINNSLRNTLLVDELMKQVFSSRVKKVVSIYFHSMDAVVAEKISSVFCEYIVHELIKYLPNYLLTEKEMLEVLRLAKRSLNMKSLPSSQVYVSESSNMRIEFFSRSDNKRDDEKILSHSGSTSDIEANPKKSLIM